MIDPSRINGIEQCICSACPTCGQSDLRKKKTVSNFQSIDWVDCACVVTHYERHHYYCRHCRKSIVAPLPEGIEQSPFSHSMRAIISAFSSRFHLSKRDIQHVLREMLHIHIAVGTICKIEHRTAKALKPVYNEIRETIFSDNQIVYADETTWRHAGKNAYIWEATTDGLTLYEITFSRNQESRDRLLGINFNQPLVTDRYCCYRSLNMHHQYCLSHLLRNVQEFAERSGILGAIGKKLVKELKAIFGPWRMYQDGEIPFETMVSRINYRRKVLKDTLKEGYYCGDKRMKSFCKRVLEDFDCLWTFLRIHGMEPTNNRAERDLRPMVLWRKKSFGTKGKKGLEFVETAGSVVQSLRKQGRNLIEFLTQALRCENQEGYPSINSI